MTSGQSVREPRPVCRCRHATTFFFGRFLSRCARYRGFPVPQKRHLPDQTPSISMRWRPLDLRVRNSLGAEWEVVGVDLQAVGAAHDRAVVVGVGHIRHVSLSRSALICCPLALMQMSGWARPGLCQAREDAERAIISSHRPPAKLRAASTKKATAHP